MCSLKWPFKKQSIGFSARNIPQSDFQGPLLLWVLHCAALWHRRFQDAITYLINQALLVYVWKWYFLTGVGFENLQREFFVFWKLLQFLIGFPDLFKSFISVFVKMFFPSSASDGNVCQRTTSGLSTFHLDIKNLNWIFSCMERLSNVSQRTLNIQAPAKILKSKNKDYVVNNSDAISFNSTQLLS